MLRMYFVNRTSPCSLGLPASYYGKRWQSGISQKLLFDEESHKDGGLMAQAWEFSRRLQWEITLKLHLHLWNSYRRWYVPYFWINFATLSSDRWTWTRINADAIDGRPVVPLSTVRLCTRNWPYFTFPRWCWLPGAINNYWRQMAIG